MTALYEQPLGDERKYLKALVARYPGKIEFETGAGHVLYDLLARLPTIPQLDDQKMALCKHIAETVHPLVSCLFAQSVHMTLTVSDEPLLPPEVIAGIGTYSAFDVKKGVLRHGFLSAPEGVSYIDALVISAGLGVLCEPLNLASQQFHDTTRDSVHTNIDVIWQWTERMVHDWYNLRGGQSFVPVRLRTAMGHVGSLQMLAATDAAALAIIQGTHSIQAGVLPGKPAEPQRMTAAFFDEASFAETATQPRSQVNAPVQRQPVPSTPVQPATPSDAAQTAKTNPVSGPSKDDVASEAKHPDRHGLHHDTPHPDVV